MSTHGLPTKEEREFNASIHDERLRQISKGYTFEHDRRHGMEHLINLAIDLVYHDEKIKSAAVLLAILDAHKKAIARTKARWIFYGVIIGVALECLIVFIFHVLGSK